MPAVMEIDVKTKEWTGKLPSHCKNVCVQWLDDDDIWRPTGPKAPRPKSKTIALIEKFMKTGPLKYKKYRLIPATGDHGGESNDEEVAMATKEKKEKKAKKAKEEVELVAGRFRPDSLLAKMYELLKDGKARTPDEIAKVVKPKSVANITKGRFRQLRKWGNRSEMYSAVITDEGKVQLLPFGKEPKKAEKKAETKKEAPAKKEAKKAETKKGNGKGKKEAKKETAAPAAKKSGPSVEA